MKTFPWSSVILLSALFLGTFEGRPQNNDASQGYIPTLDDPKTQSVPPEAVTLHQTILHLDEPAGKEVTLSAGEKLTIRAIGSTKYKVEWPSSEGALKGWVVREDVQFLDFRPAPPVFITPSIGTSREKVIKILGEPNSTKSPTPGMEILRYEHYERGSKEEASSYPNSHGVLRVAEKEVTLSDGKVTQVNDSKNLMPISVIHQPPLKGRILEAIFVRAEGPTSPAVSINANEVVDVQMEAMQKLWVRIISSSGAREGWVARGLLDFPMSDRPRATESGKASEYIGGAVAPMGPVKTGRADPDGRFKKLESPASGEEVLQVATDPPLMVHVLETVPLNSTRSSNDALVTVPAQASVQLLAVGAMRVKISAEQNSGTKTEGWIDRFKIEPLSEKTLADIRIQDNSRQRLEVAIKYKRVFDGMTQEEVKKALGDPSEIKRDPSNGTETWTYKTHKTVKVTQVTGVDRAGVAVVKKQYTKTEEVILNVVVFHNGFVITP